MLGATLANTADSVSGNPPDNGGMSYEAGIAMSTITEFGTKGSWARASSKAQQSSRCFRRDMRRVNRPMDPSRNVFFTVKLAVEAIIGKKKTRMMVLPRKAHLIRSMYLEMHIK